MRAFGGMCVAAALAACGGRGTSTDDAPWERQASIEAVPVLAACGTPTVDGVLSPGEWDGAVAVRFDLDLPSTSEVGAVAPAEIMARSDDENLYVAFRLGADTSAYGHRLSVTLDANGSGTADDGDDQLEYSWAAGGSGGQALFADEFLWDCLLGPGARSICDTPDPGGWLAELLNGTHDGGGAIHFGDDETTIELWHPYTGRDPRDVERTAGQVIPAVFSFDLTDGCDLGGIFGPYCGATTLFPSSRYESIFPEACTAPAADPHVVAIRIGTSGEPLPTIDIVPGDAERSVAVTVLGSNALDVRDVDPSTLFFMWAPVARDRSGAALASIEDVDGDGVDDLTARFRTLGLQYGYDGWYTSLAGRTRTGRRFHGWTLVRVLLDGQ